MNRLKIYVTFLFTAVYSISCSQEEIKVKKFRFGLDIGVDFPNKQYAKFLDGSHTNGVSRILNDDYYRDRIETQLGYPILGWEFSQNNTYEPSVFTGLYLGYDVAPTFSIAMKLDFSIVRFATPFVIQLNNPQNFTGEYEEALINAREQRFLFGLGVEKRFETETPISPYISFGAAFSYIKLESHELIIANTSYNIMRVYSVQTLNYQKTDGYGYGGYAEAGISYWLNDQFTLNLGALLNIQKNDKYVENLTNNSSYNTNAVEEAKGFRPSIGAYLRIIWN